MTASVEVRSLRVTLGGMKLRGTAYIPESDAGASPSAILYHGFGGHRIEASRLFVQLSRALAVDGIAVVAFDRMGHGESDGDFFDTTVAGDIRDSLRLLERIAAYAFVDEDNVHLVGFSMGAVIASTVAAESPRPVRSLTLWSPAAVFVDEVRGGKLHGQPIGRISTDGYLDVRGMRLGPGFVEDAKTFDVYGRARGYQGPVRVLHGDRDFIPHSYAEAYSDVYGDAMEYTLVPEADHTWERVPAREYVIAESVAFIRSHASW